MACCLLKLLEKENRNKSEETLTGVLYMEEVYVKELIHKTMPKLNITDVKRVNNNFLESMYLFKKAEYESRYGATKEDLLLHVTGQSNIESITKNNLDWRKVYRGSYGKGNYFSSDAMLANKICNPLCGSKRAIIVCKVLICRSIASTDLTFFSRPVSNFDTFTAYSGHVFIKFGDNEFLPIFVAFYDYSGSN